MAFFAKTITWIIRLFQFLFAVILTGILSYMIHVLHKYHAHQPREVIEPEVFSVLAIVFSCFSLLSVCFLSYTFQLLATFLDFSIFVGYLAAVGLLHRDFHSHRYANPLFVKLNTARINGGAHLQHLHADLDSALVKLLVALVCIQIITFFFTTLLGVYVAMQDKKNVDTHTTHRRRTFLHRSEKHNRDVAAADAEMGQTQQV